LCRRISLGKTDAGTEDGNEDSGSDNREDDPEESEWDGAGKHRLTARMTGHEPGEKQKAAVEAERSADAGKKNERRANGVENGRESHGRATGKISRPYEAPRVAPSKFGAVHPVDEEACNPAEREDIEDCTDKCEEAPPEQGRRKPGDHVSPIAAVGDGGNDKIAGVEQTESGEDPKKIGESRELAGAAKQEETEDTEEDVRCGARGRNSAVG